MGRMVFAGLIALSWLMWAIPYTGIGGEYGALGVFLLAWSVSMPLSAALLCVGFVLVLVEVYRYRGRVWQSIALTLIGGTPYLWMVLSPEYRSS